MLDLVVSILYIFFFKYAALRWFSIKRLNLVFQIQNLKRATFHADFRNDRRCIHPYIKLCTVVCIFFFWIGGEKLWIEDWIDSRKDKEHKRKYGSRGQMPLRIINWLTFTYSRRAGGTIFLCIILHNEAICVTAISCEVIFFDPTSGCNFMFCHHNTIYIFSILFFLLKLWFTIVLGAVSKCLPKRLLTRQHTIIVLNIKKK